MFSPDTLSDIIRKIDRWTQEELTENINDVLPALVNSLKDVEQKSLAIQSINILLDRCLKCVPVSDIDSNILRHALPTAKDIFKEALDGITVVLQDTENLSDDEMELTLGSLHHVCFGLLNQLNDALHTISSWCPLPAVKVSSMPCTVLRVLCSAFTHCRDSEELYGCAGEHLTRLFNNSQMLLSSLEPLLQTGLQFNLNCEEDEILLKNVLESLASVAKSTTTLGVSVQTIAWTTYVNIVEKYSSFRDIWTICDLSSPVETLATTISDVLSQIFDIRWTDITVGVKTLTILSFLVRVLTKLCCVFSGHLTDTCMPSMIRLLELLHRSCLIEAGDIQTKSVLLKEAEKRVGVAAASLISSLVNDRSFLQAYFSITKQEQSCDISFGWLLMGTGICRILVSCNSEIRKPWMSNPEAHILMSIFQLLSSCHNELCSGRKFTAPNSHGKPARLIDLYEYILISVGAFVLLTPPDSFGLVEASLLKNITQPDHWKGLFALDLWCIIARQSPTSVRVNQISFVLQSLSTQQPVQCNPNQIHLRLLLTRLWPLLPSLQQAVLLNKYSPMSMPQAWETVPLQILPESIVPNDVLCDTSTAIENYIASPTVDSYKQMVKGIKCAVLLLSVENNLIKLKSIPSHLIFSLSALWSLIGNPLMKFAHECWLSYFLYTVCDLTKWLCTILSNSQLTEILKKSLDIFSSGTSHIKLKILTILHALAEKVFDCDTVQQCVFQAVVSVFVIALQDKNYLVQQEALNTFEYFAHMTSHEEIIKICLKDSKAVQDNVALYLKKTPISIQIKNKGYEYADYLKLQNKLKFSYKCKMKNKKPCYKNTVPKHSKHLPSNTNISVEDNDSCDPEITNAIQRLQTDTEFISKICTSSTLSKSAKAKLLNDMNEVIKSVSELCLLLKE